jgi:hypothetical protein
MKPGGGITMKGNDVNMQDKKLEEAMANVDRSLAKVTEAAKVEKFPDELFVSTLEDSETRLRKIYEANEDEVKRAKETILRCEEDNEQIRRFLLGIHAAKTEISRP